MLRRLLSWVRCLIGDHDWTCAAAQGIKPSPAQTANLMGFYDYAKMYCSRCRRLSRLNRRDVLGEG